MAISITPKTLATGVDNPNKQISKNAWNAGHELTAAPNVLIGTDGDGEAIEVETGTGPGQVPTGDDLADYVTSAELAAAIDAIPSARVSVLDYGAVGDGVTDDYAAFQAAIADLPAGGGTIHVPGLTYLIGTEPSVGSKSVYWDIDPIAVFSGAGSGEGDFPYMTTNFAQLAVGPYIRSQSTQKSTHPNGGIAAFNVEMIQPADYGAGQSVAIYAGAQISDNDPAANGWAANFLGAAEAGAGGVMTVLEVDANTNSAGATVKGIAISGGGSENADAAIEIGRIAPQVWDLGISISSATIGVINTPTGDASSVGIVLHGPTGSDVALTLGTAFLARQYGNGNDTIFLQRKTDTVPTGYFFRAVNAANSESLVLLDVSGNLTLSGQEILTSSSSAGGTHLILKNLSTAAATSKYVRAGLQGTDTVGTLKDAGGLRLDPMDVNWASAKMTLEVRRGDALLPGLVLFGTGTPEGSVTATPGALYTRSDGGAGTTLYVKETGTGNTGWVAK